MKYLLLFVFFSINIVATYCQDMGTIIGYVFEENNRGYLQNAEVIIRHPQLAEALTTFTGKGGKFEVSMPLMDGTYQVVVNKNAFERGSSTFSKKDATPSNSIFVKVEMSRLPGYLLDMNVVNWVSAENPTNVFGIEGAHIEIYNNTLQKEVLNLENHASPNIQVLLEQGNEYIFMVRKEGYYTKQMRANVNVNGCILCMEGFGDVTPKVVDNLTQENTMGSLGTEVSMRKMIVGENLKLEDIYYDLGKSTLRPEAIQGLNRLIQLLDNNPNIIVELSSHTDSRGGKEANMALSQRRANSVMNYIKQRLKIDDSRISAKGYGESRLVNSCSDGVSCSEEMHQKNRRTELTIVDLLVDKGNQQRSLASIMQERNFDKILEANTTSYAESGTKSEATPSTRPLSKPKTIPMNYSGFKIELVAEPGDISPQHPLFYAFDEVYIDMDKNQWTSFMIDHFKTKTEAEQSLLQYVTNFPSSKIIQYTNGKRQE